MLSWHVQKKERTRSAVLYTLYIHAIVMELAIARVKELAIAIYILKIRSHVPKHGKVLKQKTRYITNSIPFRVFHILARSTAFVGAWLDIEILMTPCFYAMHRREIPHFVYRKFDTGINNKTACSSTWTH